MFQVLRLLRLYRIILGVLYEKGVTPVTDVTYIGKGSYTEENIDVTYRNKINLLSSNNEDWKSR